MTIYDLTEALKRNARLLVIGFSILMVVVLAMTFTFEDGSIAWRAKQTYSSSIQIAVISPDTTSLTTTDIRGDRLRTQASLYTGLIQTDEAVLAVGEIAGYELEDPIDARLDDNAAVITATTIGPTPDAAIAAAEGVFTWLGDKLREPLNTADLSEDTTPTTVPLIFLDGPFESALQVEFDQTLSGVPAETFLQIGIDAADPATYSISENAGTMVSSGAVLTPTTSLVLRLIGDNEETFDVTRAAAPPLPALVPSIPALKVTFGQGAVTTEGSPTLDGDAIELQWVDDVRTAIADPEPVIESGIEIANLTSELGVTPIGGRRGPITAVAVLLVGMLVLLAIVIVKESWQRARFEAVGDESAVITPESIETELVVPEGDLEEAMLGPHPDATSEEIGLEPEQVTTDDPDMARRQ